MQASDPAVPVRAPDDHEPPVADGPPSPDGQVPAPLRLDAPRDGVPPVVTTPQALAETVRRLVAGSGPLAVDAERASGHRYGQRAFLVQLRRAGAGTALVDPAALPDLSTLGDALRDAEWVLHAASQDLPCLAEVGMRPDVLFDTELGGRLAGLPRVGLAAMVEELLGYSLAKEHSAVDWSVRPLPEPWLSYAALDVEVLIELRDRIESELDAQGKLDWARQEFAALAVAPAAAPRQDPWRRTSGMHRVRTRRQLATLRELWYSREELARERDVSPGRLLTDSAIIEASMASTAGAADLADLHGFTGRAARRYARRWADAIARARALPEAELPPQHLPTEGPPPARVWSERDPAAAARLAACRAAVTALARQHHMPAENVLGPDVLRRLAWEPPAADAQQPVDAGQVSAALLERGARRWQVDLTAEALAAALQRSAGAAAAS